jgi:hypothetical protein
MSGEIRSSGRAPITKRAKKQAKALRAAPEYERLRVLHDEASHLSDGAPMAPSSISTPFGTRLPAYRRKAARARSDRWTQ